MISKLLKSRSGNALIVALIISVLILLGGVALITRNVQQSRLAKRNVNESRALVTAHSFAALLKADLETNYKNYLSAAAWAPCRGVLPVNADSYLKILANPVSGGATCPAVTFHFNYFAEVITTGIGLGASDVALSALKTTKVAPVDPGPPKGYRTINDFKVELSLADFNLDALRNSVSSPLQLSTTGKLDAMMNKSLRLVIDIKRTIAAASGNDCGICRTVPGAVCCGTAVNMTYLESGTGRLMEAVYDEGSSSIVSQTPNPTFIGQENPAAISVKNLATTRTDYTDTSFCIAAIDGNTALRYIVDGATDDSGTTYYLTTHGDILKDDGTKVSSDPKIVSLAYDQKWYLLRSDGQIMKANDLTNPNAFLPIGAFIIPNAAALAMGKGPTTACNP